LEKAPLLNILTVDQPINPDITKNKRDKATNLALTGFTSFILLLFWFGDILFIFVVERLRGKIGWFIFRIP
jgi:hypothetical protein